MKKRLIKNTILMLLALLLCLSSLSGCKKDEVDKDNDKEVEKAEYLQLLGFESYEEFTGAKISIGNMLGKMDINTDKSYISQGKGSLEVNPQGDYNEPNKHPYFKLDFLNTTCATCDFTEFKNVAFDVFNATDEELHVRVSLSVGKDDGVYTTTIKSTYALKPNDWTTCTYDISEMAGFTYYDFANVRYMTIEFMEHKETIDDAVNKLFIDNLVGNYYADGEKAAEVTYDFWEGITFEESTDQYLVFGDDVDVNKVELSRAVYEEEGIEVRPELGKYGLKADATGSIWPKFSVRLGEKVPADTLFTFMAYIQVDAAENDTFSFESYSVFGGNSVPNIISISETEFNNWFKVSVRTSIETDVISGFFNFDNFSDPVTGHSRFGDKPVAIYLDNMQLSEYVDPLTLTPKNPDFVSGITFEKDGEQYLFANERTWDNVKFVLSRIAWSDEGMKVGSEFGEYGMKGNAQGSTYPEMTIYYKKEVPANSILTFKAFIKTDASKTYYKADGTKVTSVKSESLGNVDLSGELPLNEWVDIKIRLTEATDSTTMFFNFDNGKDTTCFGNDKVVIYFDNVKIEYPIKAEGDFFEGIGFEVAGNAALFTPINKAGEEYMDAAIERVTYKSAGIKAPENGEEHALKISHDSFFWPRFRINFGEKLEAGTTITFMAYGKVNGDTLYDMSLFEYTSGGEASKQFALEEWTEISIVLKEDAEYLDLFWNYDRAGGLKEGTSGEMYIDNVKATLPIKAVGDFFEGVGFEVSGNEALFTGQGKVEHDATIQRVTYTSAGIAAPENGGSYALKLSHSSFFWPTFRINFGEELKAGTEIKFMAYGKINGESLYNQSIFEYSDGGEATMQFKNGSWTELTIVLKEDASYLDLYWNYDRAGGLKEGTSAEVYIDNIKAVEPVPEVEPVGDFAEGIGFEVAGNEANFKGQKVQGAEWMDATIERVAYDSLGVSAPTDGETHALKISHENCFWPKFQINLGKEYPAGTKITFMAYGKINGESLYNQSIFEFDGAGGTGEATRQFLCDEWTELTITLQEATDVIKLYWNYDRAGVAEGTSAEVYIDNIKATEPEPYVESDIYEGINFEYSGHETYITGKGAWNDVAVEKVDYASLSIPKLENGDDYVMQLTNSNSLWPAIQLNFGKELPAGTEVSFMVYGVIHGDTNNNMTKFEYINADGTGTGLDAGSPFNLNEWTLVTMTLPEAADKVYLCWNMDYAGGVDEGTETGELYIDNMKASEPTPVVETDIYDGINFEYSEHETYVTGKGAWNDVAVERVDYASLSIPELENGDDYVMKLSNSNSLWPAIQLNFGKELPAGTEVSFMVYGIIHGDTNNNMTKFEYINADSTGTGLDAGSPFNLNEWTLVTMTLPEAADKVYLCWNMDYAGGVDEGTETGELYIDNMKAAEPTPVVEPEGDFLVGVDFEVEGNALLFTGQNVAGSEYRDATIERVEYSASGIDVPENGGSYALKLSHANNYWPTFRINFGKELAAGTVITFQAYGKITSGTFTTEQSTFEGPFVIGGDVDQWGQFAHNGWKELTFTLNEACEYLDLFWNYDRAGITSTTASGEVYIDNMKAEEPRPVVDADIYEGINFEYSEYESYITGLAGNGNTVVAERVSYNDISNITALTDGGSYAMKLSGSNMWPTLTLNFGKELAAGTKVSFWAYTIVENYTTDYAVFGYQGGTYHGQDASNGFNLNKWQLVEITLKETAGTLDLYWNMAPAYPNDSVPASGVMYIDNLKATDPTPIVEPDIYEGINFEYSEHETYITGLAGNGNTVVAERVSYDDASNVTALTDGGSYAMKLSGTNMWPTLTFDFGKELAAGTKISFWAYTIVQNYTTDYAVFGYQGGTYHGQDASNGFNLNKWQLVEITLKEAASTLDLYWNMAPAYPNDSVPASGVMYIDNLKATEPTPIVEPEGDFLVGVDFEVEGNALLFTGQNVAGSEYRDATIERVEYGAAGIAAPENGGSYGLKLSHAVNYWPTFRINFGKELAAGTVITFQAYGNITSGTFTTEQSTFEGPFVIGGDVDQWGQFAHDGWKELTFTLNEACEYLDLFWNYDRAGITSETASGEVYIDNMVASEPYEFDITQGTGFEQEKDAAYITGLEGNGNTVVAERVSYDDISNATALTDGGSYAMKLSGTNMWPTLTFHFGKELAAGTKISFWAYTIVENYTTDYAVFGYQGGTYHGQDASNGFNLNKWQLVEITLKETAGTLDLYWNMAPAYPNDSVPASGVMYIDNMIAVEPINISTGIDFETEEQATFLTGLAGNGNTVVAERVSYDDVSNVTALTDGGSYAMKLSGTNMWPTLTLNFGKELAAGTKISFWAYTIVENYTTDYGVFGYQGGTYHGQDASNGFNLNKWQLVEITLKEAASTLDLYWNMAPAYPNDSVPASGVMYIDNLSATETN